MTPPRVAPRARALIGGGLAAGALAYAARGELLAALLPAIGWLVDALLPDGVGRTALAFAHVQGQEAFALDVALTRPLEAGGALVPAGVALHATTLAAYALQDVVVVYAVSSAWPAERARERAMMLMLGLPAAAIAILLDIPFVLAGLLHDLLIEAGAASTASPVLAVCYEFLHRGGRAGISIAIAVAVCLPFTARGAQLAAHEARPRRAGLEGGGRQVGAAQHPPAFE